MASKDIRLETDIKEAIMRVWTREQASLNCTKGSATKGQCL